jgi:hypothetical protein
VCRVLKKLNEVEGKEQYRVEISNRFAALENLDTEVDVNKAWETAQLFCICQIPDKNGSEYITLLTYIYIYTEG